MKTMTKSKSAHSHRITVEWDGEWWTISDEGGEYAQATELNQALSYVEELMWGPPTIPGAEMNRWLRHGKTKRLR